MASAAATCRLAVEATAPPTRTIPAAIAACASVLEVQRPRSTSARSRRTLVVATGSARSAVERVAQAPSQRPQTGLHLGRVRFSDHLVHQCCGEHRRTSGLGLGEEAGETRTLDLHHHISGGGIAMPDRVVRHALDRS